MPRDSTVPEAYGRTLPEEAVQAVYGPMYRRARRLLRQHARELNGEGERLLQRAAWICWLDSGRLPDYLRREGP